VELTDRTLGIGLSLAHKVIDRMDKWLGLDIETPAVSGASDKAIAPTD
jgi:hypothetical protein